MDPSADLESIFCRAHLLPPHKCFYDIRVAITSHSQYIYQPKQADEEQVPGRWVKMMGVSKAVVPNHQQQFRVRNTLHNNLLSLPGNPEDVVVASLVTALPEGTPAVGAEVRAILHECKSPLKIKRGLMYFKPGCQNKFLGFMSASLSSLISAASPKWEASLLEQTFQQQLYKTKYKIIK